MIFKCSQPVWNSKLAFGTASEVWGEILTWLDRSLSRGMPAVNPRAAESTNERPLARAGRPAGGARTNQETTQGAIT